MKLSKLRQKARAAFTRGCVWLRTDDGRLHAADPAELFVEVVVIRGRQFTRPQCAVQSDR